METTEATTEAIEIAASASGEMDGGDSVYEGTDGDALAQSLAEVAPSAGLLDRLACERLSATGRLDAMVAWERLVRHAQAGLTRALGALARLEGDEGWHIEDEVGAALAWAPSTAQNRLIEAEALTRLFPATEQQLSEGR